MKDFKGGVAVITGGASGIGLEFARTAAGLGMKGMGQVMGVVTPQTKGRADGGAVAAEVRRQLAG